MGEIKLKPCPFCGGKAAFETMAMFVSPAITVMCRKCEARCKPVGISADYAAKEVAADRWNKRAQEDVQERVVDIMDDVMGNICDEYCKYPDYLSDDALNAKCDECPFERLG